MIPGLCNRANWSIAITLVTVATAGAGRTVSAQAPRSERGSPCIPNAFAKVMLLDERSLRRQQRMEVGVDAAEGSTITLFRDGSSIRIVRLLDLGETGRSEKSAFVVDSMHFLVWVVEQRYQRAIEARRPPVVESSSQSVFLVCGGEPEAGSDDDAKDIISRVQKALRGAAEKE